MSDPNSSKVYDVDDDEGSSCRDTNTGSDTANPPTASTKVRTKDPPGTARYRLPDGQLIDCKNTLQSFDHVATHQLAVPSPDLPTPGTTNNNTTNNNFTNNGGPGNAWNDPNTTAAATAAIAPSPNAFLLPNGQIMNSKNTLQSFDHLVERSSPQQQLQRRLAAMTAAASAKKPAAIGNTGNTPIITNRDGESISNGDNHAVHQNTIDVNGSYNQNHGDHTIRVQAIPVRSVLVAEGEIFDPGMTAPTSAASSNKYRTALWLLSMIIVAAIAGVGGYCGAGKCRSTSTPPLLDVPTVSTISSASPNIAPIIIVPAPFESNSPTTVPSVANVTSDVFAPIVKNETAAPPESPSFSPVTRTTSSPITEVPVTPNPSTPVDTLAGIILSASPESSNRLSIPGTTQSQALEWIRLALVTGTFGTDLPDVRTVQIWTLATLAFSLGLSESWLNNGGNDECLWDGIICSAATRAVVGIDLVGRSITGTLPPEISLLNGLIGLNISTNNIAGRLPSDFGTSFQQLVDLRFDRNEIPGTLPSTVGMMSALRFWYMERNPALSGTVPSTVAQLSNLEEFVLYYTDITGVITQGTCDLLSGSLKVLTLDCTKISFDGEPCWTNCLFLCDGDTGLPCNDTSR